MGAVISAETLNEVKSNELLKRLAGSEPLSDNDPLWNKLFSFNFNIQQRKRAAQREFLTAVKNHLESLLHNNPKTGNFGTLTRVFARHCCELESSTKCGNKILIWHCNNALLTIRYVCAFFAERLSPIEFVSAFNTRGSGQLALEEDEESPVPLSVELGVADSQSAAPQFLANLLDIVYRLELSNLTDSVHREVIRVILALLSTQLYSESITVDANQFFGYLMKTERDKSIEVIRVLLENFLYQIAEPTETMGGDSKGGSLVISLASSMWTALQRTVSMVEEGEEEGGGAMEVNADYPPQTLATLSVALLMSLVCYPIHNGKPNPYREAMEMFENAQEISSLANKEASFKLDFTALYNRLCATAEQRLPMLLLYMLTHKNIGFRNFLLSRVNIEQLVVPVLRALNEGVSAGSASDSDENGRADSPHHTYLALIIMLMLSEDDFFCKIIHETKIKNVDWYQRSRPPISEITLGGLVVLVFIKTIHTNTLRTRDRYLHTNSLAALANMSSCFKSLSPLVCQRFIGLLETMTKRHAKLIQVMREHAETAEENKADQTNGQEDEEPQNDGLHRDITALEEGIRTLLEILNSCLCNNLRYNADLIYSILYNRDLFDLYHNHPMFHDLVWNIYVVINHFSNKVQPPSKISGTNDSMVGKSNVNGVGGNRTTSSTTPPSPSSRSVHEVLDCIRRAAVEWPTDRLKRFPELKFKYVEDENTVDFFVPYVWRLIHMNCGLYFTPESIKLFNAF